MTVRQRLLGLRPQASGPLAGSIVCDFSFNMAGPYCTMLLADLGALVLKIEPPRGEPHRHMGATPGSGMGAPWALVNRDKLSVVIDLKDEQQRETLLFPILDAADIVLHNFKPATADALGIDAESVRVRNPEAIHCAISGFGSSPAVRHLAGVDIIAETFAGVSSVTGFPDRGPAKVGVPLGDVGAGLLATIEILGRFVEREHGRSPNAAAVTLVEGMAAFGTFNLANAARGARPTFQGGDHSFMAPYGYFRVGDDWLALGLATDAHWSLLCDLLGVPELRERPEYARLSSRHAHRDELRTEIERALATRTAREWEDVLAPAGLPCCAVRSYSEVLEEPVFHESGVLEPVAHPSLGDFVHLHPLSWGRHQRHEPARRLDSDRLAVEEALRPPS